MAQPETKPTTSSSEPARRSVAFLRQSRRATVVNLTTVLASVVILMALESQTVAAETQSVVAISPAETLREAGVDPTPEGVRRFLHAIDADPNLRHRLDGLVGKLESEVYSERESATQELLRTPLLPEDWLTVRQRTASPEARWRLHRVTQHQSVQSGAVLRAAFAFVGEHPAEFSLADVLAAAPVLQRADLQAAYSRLLRRMTTPGSLADLRRAAEDLLPAKRAAAAVALAAVATPAAQELLLRLAADGDGRTALTASLALADAGEREAVVHLVDLLDHASYDIRHEASRTLESFAAQRFDYLPEAPPAERASGVRAWRDWAQSDGRTAPLYFPLRISQLDRRPLAGRLLFATGGMGRVVEHDARGGETFSYPIQSWSAEPLPSGNVLIASHWRRIVLEVTREGSVAWSHEGVSAIRAKPLLGGNVLIADIQLNRALEIDRKGQIVWKHETPEQCFDVERLQNGDTLVACPNAVRQISADGALVAEWPQSGRVNSLQLLSTGNLLVANYGLGAVVELDRAGKEVWRAAVDRPTDAFRTRTGATLVATSEKLVELGPDGRILREIAPAQSGCARQ
jgi:hypothetical protein